MKVSYCQRWSSKTSKPEFRKIDLQKRPTRILPFGFEWLKSQGTFPFVSSEGETNENKHDIQSRNRERSTAIARSSWGPSSEKLQVVLSTQGAQPGTGARSKSHHWQPNLEEDVSSLFKQTEPEDEIISPAVIFAFLSETFTVLQFKHKILKFEIKDPYLDDSFF